jgi:hypothetical protein
MKLSKLLIPVVLALTASVSTADWHGGRVTQINIGYDGSTITFVVEGWVRTNCTCYSVWSNTMCLDRSRASFKEEAVMLFSARARETELYANIDEASCRVVALYEIG